MYKDTVNIKTTLSYQEAIKALKNNSVRNYFQIKGEDLVGTVTSEKVVFYRGVWLQNNSFTPVFKGKLIEEEQAVFLKGKWGLHWFAKYSMMIFALFPFYSILLNGFTKDNIVFLLVVWGFLFLMYVIGKKLSEKDKNWIISRLQSILKS